MRSVGQRLLGYFLAGVFTILPLVITVAVIVWVGGIIQGMIGPNTVLGGWLRSAGVHFVGDGAVAYFVGCLLVLAAIFVLGVLVQLGFRKVLHAVADPVLRAIPVAGSVYGAASQLVGLLEQRDDSELQGMSVVYCLFGEHHGAGLLALLPTPDRYTISGREHYLVYIPTSPVPMTGGLLFVPVDAIQRVEMSVESLMSVYLSMGVTGPDFLKRLEPAS